MVSIEIFAGSSKNQFLRTLIAISIFALGDLFYYFLTGGIYNGTKLSNKKFPWIPCITLWITVGFVFGVSEILESNSEEKTMESDSVTMITDSTFFGVLVALLLYGPLISFVYYPNGSSIIGLMNFGFAIILCAITSMLTNLISQNHSLYGFE